MATSPAYFRGFTLIALKEGREGTTDDDYTGQFQVRMRAQQMSSLVWVRVRHGIFPQVPTVLFVLFESK